MKAKIILTALVATILAACNTDKVRPFIPGTYVNSAKSEFSQASDTLIITHLSGDAYLITRQTTYQVIRDHKPLPKHHKTQKLTGIYDGQKQALMETTNGREFLFDPDKHLMQVNSARYQKIN